MGIWRTSCVDMKTNERMKENSNEGRSKKEDYVDRIRATI